MASPDDTRSVADGVCRTLTVLARTTPPVLASQRTAGGRYEFDFVPGETPTLSFSAFMTRFSVYCPEACSMTFLVAMGLVLRFCAKTRSVLTSTNLYRLWASSFVVATKLVDDVHTNLAFVARVAGLSPEELCFLERSLLVGLESDIAFSTRDVLELEGLLPRFAPCGLPAFGEHRRVDCVRVAE